MEKQINIRGHAHVLLEQEQKTAEESLLLSQAYRKQMEKRRSVRDFSNRPVAKEIIENLIMTASSAPSGAHKQPWTFCVVGSESLKQKIREAAEKEEKESYQNRMSERWLKDLEPLGTDWSKPFLTKVPWIIVVFKKVYDQVDGQKHTHYYVNESVGLACGFLIQAIHNCGLSTLTHTPSPMNFLTKLLDRPDHERPFLLIPVGYPEDPCYVPKLERKSLQEVTVFYE